MRIQVVGRIVGMLATLLVIVVFGASDIQSQQTRNRPSRRATNPVRRTTTPPSPPSTSPTPATRTPTDATIISTADQQPTPDDTGAAEPRRTTTPRRRTRAQVVQDAEDEQQQLRRTVNRLSDQVTRLSEDLSSMKEQQRTLVDLERLSRAEQRAEGFRTQLREVSEKELGLEARLEQIEYEIQPDAIERRTALIGSLRPAELREQVRRQLESERNRVQQQLNLLRTSRSRLEAAVSTADLEVERLRARLDEADRRATDAGANTTPDTSSPRRTEPSTPGEPPVN